MEGDGGNICAILDVTAAADQAGPVAGEFPECDPDAASAAEDDAAPSCQARPNPAPFPTDQGGGTDFPELEPLMRPKSLPMDVTATTSMSMSKIDSHPQAMAPGAAAGGDAAASNLLGRIKFCIREAPGMSRTGQVRYLRRFRLGDTYKLKTRSWLVPQFLSGALTLTGVVLTLVGIISLQINKYLHACDDDDGIDCRSSNADINNVMMPIGVGTTGGGLTLILISGFVFLHAFCVIYEDVDGEAEGAVEAALHIPLLQRAALLGSATALSPEAVARCHSYYDNLQDYCPAD